MIIDAISDLHGHYPELEGGDLLIIAGDLTASDMEDQYIKFFDWLCDQKYKKKIVVAGNHDKKIYEGIITISSKDNIDYLCDSQTEFEGLTIWGSPWTKTFDGMNEYCKAFTVEVEQELADKFENIPNVDILVTHSPAYGILDKIKIKSYKSMADREEHVGSQFLYGWLKYCHRPKLHVFGHVHESYGIEEVLVGHNDIMVKSINASHMNELYKPTNNPIRIIL